MGRLLIIIIVVISFTPATCSPRAPSLIGIDLRRRARPKHARRAGLVLIVTEINVFVVIVAVVRVLAFLLLLTTLTYFRLFCLLGRTRFISWSAL